MSLRQIFKREIVEAIRAELETGPVDYYYDRADELRPYAYEDGLAKAIEVVEQYFDKADKPWTFDGEEK